MAENDKKRYERVSIRSILRLKQATRVIDGIFIEQHFKTVKTNIDRQDLQKSIFPLSSSCRNLIFGNEHEKKGNKKKKRTAEERKKNAEENDGEKKTISPIKIGTDKEKCRPRK